MKKKIIIAGGSGFIGQELANYFKDKFLVIVLTGVIDKIVPIF
jgi:nucleoside-diphosphate-sugar epimerase